MRIKAGVELHVTLHAEVGQLYLFGHEEHFLQHLGPAQPDVGALKEHRAPLLAQQSAHEVEQGALAGAVLAQQSVDVARLEAQAEVLEHGGLAPPVAEVDFVYL